MNYVYDPQVAAQIAAYVNYFCPVKGVKEILAEKSPELANNPLIFPDDATLTQLHAVPEPRRGARARADGRDAEGHRGVSTAGATRRRRPAAAGSRCAAAGRCSRRSSSRRA